MAIQYPKLYQLGGSVGPRRANRPNDVKLVQAMIALLRGIAKDWQRETPDVEINGRYTDAVRASVAYFQHHHGKGRLVKDGIVSPMRTGALGTLLPTFSSGRVSTLFLLNAYARLNSRSQHEDLWRRVGGISEFKYGLR